MLGADARIIEPCGNGIRLDDLSVRVLQQVAVSAVQDARLAGAAQGARVVDGSLAAPAGLDAVLLDGSLVLEIVERADGVAAAADAGNERIGQLPARRLDLRADLLADHLLEVTHHARVRVRPDRRADDVVGVRDVRRPVADRLARRVLERARAARDGNDLRAQKFHAEDVEALALDVLLPHEHMALHAEERRDRRRGDAVLPCTRLGDDALLAHALCEQHLPKRIVDLVCARMQKILSLEEDARLAVMLGKLLGKVQSRRTACVLLQIAPKLRLKLLVLPASRIGGFQFLQRRHDDFRHILSAVCPESPLLFHVNPSTFFYNQ